MSPDHVADLLNDAGSWNDSIYSLFGPSLVSLVLQLPRLDARGHDALVWAHSETERMNAAAIYNEECDQSSLIGGEFWKYKAQPRMLILIWRAINNLLPTYDWLRRHRLRDDDRCPWGCDEPETVNHIFGTCRFINKIWSEGVRLKINLKPNNEQLLAYICKGGTANRKPLEINCLISIIYNIWKARNSMIHGEIFLQPAAIIAGAIQDATCGSWDVQCNHQASWTPPPANWIKINFDGSVHENNIAGLGCVIRNHKGDFIAAKGSRISSRSISMTEFRSAQLGLEVAKPFFHSAHGVILEGDSAEACLRLKRILTGHYLWDPDPHVAKLLKDTPRIEILQVDRRANGAADFIANLACNDDFYWERGMPLPQAFIDLLGLDIVSM